MKVLKVLSVVFAVLLGSAALAPFLYRHTPFEFDRILSRLVMISALLAFVFFVRVKRERLGKFGLVWDKRSPSLFTQGILLGFSILAALTVAEILLGGRRFSLNLDPAWEMVLDFGKFILAALVVGVIEEFFFRGFVYTKIREKYSLAWSLILTNAFYSVVHFFKKGGYVIPENPGFLDSLKVMLHLGEPFLEPLRLFPSFMGLFLFGLILSYAFIRTGSLLLSMGIHAGCVFFLKLDGWFVASTPSASPLIFGDKNLYSGVLGWGFFGILFMILWLVLREPLQNQKS